LEAAEQSPSYATECDSSWDDQKKLNFSAQWLKAVYGAVLMEWLPARNHFLETERKSQANSRN
jgi:hypothetical protein